MFVDESLENMDTLYEKLLELEQNPTDKSTIEEIFRAAHTLKGMSATMNYHHLAELTHALENVFDGIRYDRIKVQADMMDYILETVDHLQAIVEDIANGGNGSRDVSDTIHMLEEIDKGRTIGDTEQDQVEAMGEELQSAIDLDEFQLAILNESKDQHYENMLITIELSKNCLLKGVRAFMVFDILEQLGEVVYANPQVEQIEEEKFDTTFSILFVTQEAPKEIEAKLNKISEIEQINITSFSIADYVRTKDTKDQTAEKNDFEKQSDQTKKVNNQTVQQTASKTIRVDIDRLDSLMNLFEELVIDRGRLEQIASELKNVALDDTVERMSRVSSDLQNIILTMRMVPINTVINRFLRMIRQLAPDLHKEEIGRASCRERQDRDREPE